MIGPKEKGVKAVALTAPPLGDFEGIDLKKLPKYICYKAALLKEKMLLGNALMFVSMLLVVSFITSRFEISSLQKKLREKEYILAPGVIDFTPASPQSVTDGYVSQAIMNFLSILGNVNPDNIKEQYKYLSSYMSADLKIQFDVETNDWKKTVKKEDISEVFKVRDKEILSDEMGNYKVTAFAVREQYARNEYLGRTDEVVEMELKLVPPQQGKEWFLQITSLIRTDANSFRAKGLTSTNGREEIK